MNGIDFLEHGGGHFHIRHHGELIALPDPRTRHYQWVLGALHFGHVPGTPGDMPEWKRAAVFERWRAAWELPLFDDARRLAYLVDNYRAALNNDFATRTHHDLGALWRARRWALLIDVIDRFPAHSWYAAAVSMDEDHARMMAESLAARKDSGEKTESTGPSLTTWTPEVAALTSVLDAVRDVRYAVVAVQHGNNAGEPPRPAPRPITALEKAMRLADYNRKKAAHESLVARVLRKK